MSPLCQRFSQRLQSGEWNGDQISPQHVGELSITGFDAGVCIIQQPWSSAYVRRWVEGRVKQCKGVGGLGAIVTADYE